ncbi:hypothetical protein WJX84_007908 [Apatococcus fuscideae]|uniref:Bacterial surface antigen (D15) domain-containing protein n=1 Tax=Apatococcus fuscideae TaxID=2026836 RepID=A0AAW1TDQ3_9CHLO
MRCELADTLGELEEQLEEAIEALMELDVFLAVDAFIDQADEGGTGAVDVHLTLKEQGQLGLNIATYAQGQGGSIEGTIKLKNSLGRAEHLALKYERGSNHHTEVVLSLGRSRILGTDMSLDLDLYRQNLQSAQQSSSFSLQSTGTTANLQSHDGFHTFTYDLGWLHIYDPSNNASKAVRQQLGWKLKSALKYAFQYSTFPSIQYPTSGFGVRATQEVAGIGPGSALLKYIKSEIKAAKVLYLGGGCVLSLDAEAGFITPWGPGARSQPVPITERFRMFGSGSTGVMRGFREQGIGPVERRRCRVNQENDDPIAAAAFGDESKLLSSRLALQKAAGFKPSD